MTIEELTRYDNEVRKEVERLYEGYKIEWYASGFDFSTGQREQLFDVFLKDGSRFIAVAHYDYDGIVEVTEREYVEY